jgi:AhpD family alkylhydroperoxidase
MSDRLNYNTLAPAAMKALGGVHVYLHSQADLPKNLIDLAYLRTSQINGCAYCIDMHSHDLIAQGVPVSKLLLVSAWHEEGDIFDMRERGVLAWTETVTDVARTGVPDDAYAARCRVRSTTLLRKFLPHKSFLSFAYRCKTCNSHNIDFR